MVVFVAGASPRYRKRDGRCMWRAHLFRKTGGRLVSQLLSNTFDLKTSMILNVFSAASVILHGTMMTVGRTL
jgi:hypothetical protein